jgi:hypothetical protein
MCVPGWPQAYDPPASAFPVLGLWVYITMTTFSVFLSLVAIIFYYPFIQTRRLKDSESDFSNIRGYVS